MQQRLRETTKVSGFVCLYGRAFWNHSGPKDPTELEKVICASPLTRALTGNVYSQGKRPGHLEAPLLRGGELLSWRCSSEIKSKSFFTDTHVCAYPELHSPIWGSETSLIHSTNINWRSTLSGTILSNRERTVNQTDKNSYPYATYVLSGGGGGRQSERQIQDEVCKWWQGKQGHGNRHVTILNRMATESFTRTVTFEKCLKSVKVVTHRNSWWKNKSVVQRFKEKFKENSAAGAKWSRERALENALSNNW